MKHIKKSLALTIAVIILTLGVVGGSLAWINAQTGIITNIFKAPTIDVDVDEKIEGNVKETVAIKNNSDISVYVRVAVVVTWKDGSGNVYPQAPKIDTDYTWTLNSDDWFVKNGFYYYVKPVEASGTTSNLLTNVKEVENKAPEGYNLSVEIITQAIQAEPADAVQDAWGVVVSDGNLSSGTIG